MPTNEGACIELRFLSEILLYLTFKVCNDGSWID